MSNTKELYEKIGYMVLRLKEAHQDQSAKELEEALYISMQPGEILGAIRLCLQQIIAFPDQLPEDFRLDALEAISFIDTII